MNFREKLNSDIFVITAELFPPKGTDLSKLNSKAETIRSYVDAVNVTDNQRAVMRIGGLAVSRTLLDQGIDAVFQLTCRDRNRMALQSDLLAAWSLGIKNVLLLSGDHPALGDHKDAMPVYDLDTVQLISLAATLNNGYDMNGKPLKGHPDFFIGAVVNPNIEPMDLQLKMMKKKIQAGASFFQTQVCFDLNRLKPFIDLAHSKNVKILPSISIFSSVNLMERFREFGTSIPDPVAERLKQADDPLKESIALNSELIGQLRDIADGVHIIAINIEENIPYLFRKS